MIHDVADPHAMCSRSPHADAQLFQKNSSASIVSEHDHLARGPITRDLIRLQQLTLPLEGVEPILHPPIPPNRLYVALRPLSRVALHPPATPVAQKAHRPSKKLRTREVLPT